MKEIFIGYSVVIFFAASGVSLSTSANPLVPAAGSVKGHVTELFINAEGIPEVKGWACQVGNSAPIQIFLTGKSAAEGAYYGIAQVTANLTSAAVIGDNFCETGALAYGFDVQLNQGSPSQVANGDALFICGISPTGNGSHLLPARGGAIQLTIPSFPGGSGLRFHYWNYGAVNLCEN